MLDTPNSSGLDTSKLYTIDLNTGHATFVGEIGGGMDIISATVVPGSIPEPAGGFAMGLAAFACRRSRRA